MASSRAGTDFRMYPARLFQQQEFVDLTPIAKATYFTLRAQLPSFGLGEVIVATLAPLVGCSPEELHRALEGLTAAGWIVREGGIVWLRGCEESTNWRSPLYQTFIRDKVALLPPSVVVDEWLDEMRRRLGDGPQDRKKEAAKPVGARVPVARDTVSIQKEVERKRDREKVLHFKEKSKEEALLAKPADKDDGVSDERRPDESSPESPYDAYAELLAEVYGMGVAGFGADELAKLRRLEGREGGDGPVLQRLGRLCKFVSREALTVTELTMRWDEMGGANPAPY